MKIVKAVNLKKYFVTENYEVHAVDGVTLEIEEGEFVAVVGTSGSGKTSLLNLLGGLDVPDEGGVWIRGSGLKIWKARNGPFSDEGISGLFFNNII